MSGDLKEEKSQSSQVIPIEEHPARSSDELYREGSGYFKARDYAAACSSFERYTAEKPDDPAGFHFLARIYYHQNRNLDKAEECIKKALELDSGANETRYLETLGTIYIHRGEYEKAEEVFAYALSEDRGDDKNHTRSLESYLSLVRRKIQKRPKDQAGADNAGPPQFLKTGIERLRERNRQPVFLIPSAVIHILMLLLVYFLSTHDISIKNEKEDFTFVDIAQEEEQEQAAPEKRPRAAPAREPREEAQPVPAPVTPRREAEAGGVQKGEGPGKGRASAPERGEQGSKQQAGGKQMAKLESASKAEDVAATAAEKAVGLNTPRPSAASEDVTFARRNLGAGQEQAVKSEAREASVSRLNERSAAAPDEGIYIGEKKQEKESRFDKSRKAELNARRAEEAAPEKSLAEKKMTVASLNRPGIRQEDGRFKPSALNIGGMSQRQAQRNEEAFRSVDRSQAARAQGAAQRFEPAAGDREPVTVRKANGSIAASSNKEALSQSINGEKRANIASASGRREYASADVPGARRSLDIASRSAASWASANAPGFNSLDRKAQAGAQPGAAAARFEPGAGNRDLVTGRKTSGSIAASAGTETPAQGFSGEKRTNIASASGGRREYASAEISGARRTLDIASRSGVQGRASGSSPSVGSLDRRVQTGAQPGAGAYGMAAPGSGASAQTATGKAVVKNLGSSGQESYPGAGFLGKAADRVSRALGIGNGGTRVASMPDADIRKTRSLGISPGSGQRGGGQPWGAGSGQGAGTGTGSGYGSARIAGGEKAQASPSIRADDGGRQAAAGAAGNKKMSESPLGVPGSSAERFASLSRGEARAVAPEKRTVLPTATNNKVMAKNSAGPSVGITSPRSGRTDRLSQVITGALSDRRIRKATLTVNNDSRVISVENGRFESVVSLSKGRNTVTVMAFDSEGNVGKDSITLDYSEPREGAPVTIVSPRDGQVVDVSEQSVVSVKGTIGDQGARRATLIFNGNPIDIAVNRGYFEQKVALEQEQNTLLVEVQTTDGKVSRSQTVRVNTINVKPKDVMIILTWDKPRADFDLHVYGPGGGHTSYKTPNIYESKEAIPGAQLDQDAKGNFGPEVFTQKKADRGVYSIVSNYFYSGGDGNAHATVTVILYGDNPSRRMVRVFGPHLQVDTKSGEDNWEVAKFRMPEGIFLEE